MRKTTKDLLKETFASLPNSFAYREVRFYVYNALQKLEVLEKREANKKKTFAEQQKKLEDAKKLQPWMPPIYQTSSQVMHTLDIIDKMISDENKVIESIHAAKNAKKGQLDLPKDNDEDDDLQTLHG
jgi:hypothetical protein